MPIKITAWTCDEPSCSFKGGLHQVEDHERYHGHHNRLTCDNQDHDSCLDAQLAHGNKDDRPRDKNGSALDGMGDLTDCKKVDE